MKRLVFLKEYKDVKPNGGYTSYRMRGVFNIEDDVWAQERIDEGAAYDEEMGPPVKEAPVPTVARSYLPPVEGPEMALPKVPRSYLPPPPEPEKRPFSVHTKPIIGGN